jgi:hypothetical protein
MGPTTQPCHSPSNPLDAGVHTQGLLDVGGVQELISLSEVWSGQVSKDRQRYSIGVGSMHQPQSMCDSNDSNPDGCFGA